MPNNKEFIDLVMQNKVVDAKKIFEKSMMVKVNEKVNALRQKVAKEYFKKQ